MMITLIAAVTRGMAIGRGGDMICHLRGDLRRFRELTMGCPVVMGRRTFESLPGGALPGRRNMVLTSSATYSAPGAETFSSLADALRAAAGAEQVFIIGGGHVYAQAIPLADRLELTEIDIPAPADADTFFPAVNPDVWTRVEESVPQHDPKTGIIYRFVCYARK